MTQAENLNRIMEQYGNSIYRMSFLLLQNEQDAQDIGECGKKTLGTREKPITRNVRGGYEMRQNRIQNMMDNIELSELDKQRILNNCMKGRHVQNKVFRYSKQIAAALAVGIVCTSSLSVYAAVSAYQAYMEKMSSEEVQERYDNVQSSTKDADSFSRPLTETERDGLDQMREAYQQGLRFPEQSMVCFDGAAFDYEVNEEELSYDYTNCIFYVPERELTEEELLQIIDVWEKANYSLGIINEEQSELETTVEEENDVEAAGLAEAEKAWELYGQELSENDEEWMKQLVCKIVKDCSGNDVSDLKWEFVLYGLENPYYIAKEETLQYSIRLNPDSTAEDWTVDHYSGWEDTVGEEDRSGYTEEELTEKLESCMVLAEKQLADTFGIEDKVVKREYGYNKNVLSGESVYVEMVLTTENGDRYRLDYAINTTTCIEMLDYEAGEFDDIDILDGFDVVGEIE